MDTYHQLKYDMKKEMRAKLEREFLLSLPYHNNAEENAYNEVMEELQIELLQIEGRHAEGNDTYREDFIRKLFKRNAFTKLMLEPIDYSEYYNEDGTLRDTILP